MVSPVFRPTAPVPATWAPAGGWYGAGAASAIPAPSASPTSSADDTARWDAYVNEIRQALQTAAGQQNKLEYDKLKRQYEDAEKGRQNAYKIAQLQADTSRYGTDATREVQLKQLQENQRQFDANHGLEMQKLGLDRERFAFDKEKYAKDFGLSEAGVTGTYNGSPTEAARQFNANLGQRQYEYGTDYGLRRAQAIAQYSSTPDQMFMRSDLMDALSAAESGQGPSPYGSAGAPRAKTAADFDAIAGAPGTFGRDPGGIRGPVDISGGAVGFAEPMAPNYAGGTAGFSEGPGSGGSRGYMVQGDDGSWSQGATGISSGPSLGASRPMTNGTDPRMTAASAVMKAIPPSDTPGTDDGDMAALSAIRSLYFSRKPGTLERMRPGQQAAFTAGLSRSGFYAPDALEDLDRAKPRQGSVRMA